MSLIIHFRALFDCLRLETIMNYNLTRHQRIFGYYSHYSLLTTSPS